MRTVGLIGGLGPESTIDYYRRIIQVWQQREAASSPSIVIDSLDVQRALALVATDRAGLAEYLFASVRRLAGAGVDFIALTANTGHLVFEDLAARSPVPMISIVEVCADEAKRRGLRRLGLLGTRFTMEAEFYPAVFSTRRIEVVPPTSAERLALHERYVGELLKGDFRDETRDFVAAVITRLRDEERVDAIILGGTELPLLLRAPVVAGLPALDTTALHVDAIVERLAIPEIRPCTAADVPAILSIVNDAAQAYKGIIPPDCWHEPYMPLAELAHEIRDGVVFWGLESGAQLAGVMGIQDRGEVALIRHAYVRTRFRRGGIGARLLEHLEAMTAKPILIGTWSAAVWAIRFYEKHGYRLLSRAEASRLLRRYWNIPERQIETSVVLANAAWRG